MSEKIKLCTDEHVHSAVVAGLRRRGVDVLTTYEAGILGASDEDHLALAASQGRAIFAQDDDFLRLHARGVEHAGIVYAYQHAPIGEIVRGLMLIYQVLGPNDMKNHVEFL